MYEYNTFATFAKKRDNLKRNIAIGGGIATLAGITGVALLTRGKGGKSAITTLKNTASKTDDVVARIPVKKAATELKEQVQKTLQWKPPASPVPSPLRIPTKSTSAVLPSKPPETLQTVAEAIKRRPKPVGKLKGRRAVIGNTRNSTVGGFTRVRNGKTEQVSGYTRRVQVTVDNLTDVKSLQPRLLSPEGLAKYNKLLEKRKSVIGRGKGTGIKKLKRELNSILDGTPRRKTFGKDVIEDTDNINAILTAGKGKAVVKRYKKRSSELSDKLNTLADIQRQMDEVYIKEGLVSPRMKHQMNSGLTRMRAEVKKNSRPSAVTPEVDYANWLADLNYRFAFLVQNPKTRKAIEAVSKDGKPDKIDAILLGTLQKTLEKETLPTFKESAFIAGQVAKEVAKNPIGAIKKGQTREAVVREILKTQGIELPANTTILKDAFDKAIIRSGVAETVTVVGAGSFGGIEVGKVAAAALGIPEVVGTVGGDVFGSLILRRGVRDLDATSKALAKLQQDETFRNAPKLSQFIKLRNKAIQETTLDWKQREDGYTADVIGGLVGEATGMNITSHIPIIKDIPLSGAIGVPAASMRGIQAKDDIIAGKPILDTLRTRGGQALDDLNFPKQVKKKVRGFLDNAQKRRNAVNKRLRQAQTGKMMRELKKRNNE